jgi:hypothetical protein
MNRKLFVTDLLGPGSAPDVVLRKVDDLPGRERDPASKELQRLPVDEQSLVDRIGAEVDLEVLSSTSTELSAGRAESLGRGGFPRCRADDDRRIGRDTGIRAERADEHHVTAGLHLAVSRAERVGERILLGRDLLQPDVVCAVPLGRLTGGLPSADNPPP